MLVACAANFPDPRHVDYDAILRSVPPPPTAVTHPPSTATSSSPWTSSWRATTSLCSVPPVGRIAPVGCGCSRRTAALGEEVRLPPPPALHAP